jgi:phosphohistidine phosphatase
MDLYLIRHAVAELRRADLPDHDRALTPTGRERFERVVDGLERLGVTLDRVYHSPWRRAVETAEMSADLAQGNLEPHPGLAGGPNEDLLASLDGDAIALVGHEPWMSELLAWLVTGDSGAAGGYVMKKGGVAWLRGEPLPGGMELRALIPPKIFRELLG